MKYATFDANGRLNGRYDSDIHPAIPQGAIQLSDELFYQTISTTEGYWERVNGVIQHTIPPAPQAPINPIPTVINMAQARLALYQSGLLEQVDALIAGMPEEAKIEWQFRQTVERTHPLVDALAAALPLTSQQLDDLFTLGATL